MYTRRWTDKDSTILREMQTAGHTDAKIADVLNRTESAVTGRRAILGLGTNLDRWTESEDKIIRDNASIGPCGLVDLLPGRTIRAISARRSRLNVRCHPVWTDEDEQYLRDNLHLTDKELGETLDRTSKNVCERRRILSLKKRDKKMWTDDEVIFLRAARPGMTLAAIGEYLGRSLASVSGKWAQDKAVIKVDQVAEKNVNI